MAFRNKKIINRKTGHEIKFLQTAKETAGRLLEMEATYRPGSKEPAAHYHPLQSEDFTVLSGELTVRMDGRLLVLKPGDHLFIPRNTVHSMWNNGTGRTIVNWKVQPALNTEHLLETFTGLSNEGRTNKDGMPPLLQVALTANKYSQVLRLARPPFIIQKFLFFLLTPFAYLSGYRPTDPAYLD